MFCVSSAASLIASEILKYQVHGPATRGCASDNRLSRPVNGGWLRAATLTLAALECDGPGAEWQIRSEKTFNAHKIRAVGGFGRYGQAQGVKNEASKICGN